MGGFDTLVSAAIPPDEAGQPRLIRGSAQYMTRSMMAVTTM